MAEAVKRQYRSHLRAEQSAQTRRALVSAASRLFVEKGYGDTTIESIAGAAGVSRKTVFTAVGGKTTLLRLSLDWAVAGDDRPEPLADRLTTRRIVAKTDPAALLSEWAVMLTAVGERAAALYRALEVAAELDADARKLLQDVQCRRHSDSAVIIDRLVELEALPSTLNLEDAVDIGWLASDPILYDRMVRSRGWTGERFTTWLGALLAGQLLR